MEMNEEPTRGTVSRRFFIRSYVPTGQTVKLQSKLFRVGRRFQVSWRLSVASNCAQGRLSFTNIAEAKECSFQQYLIYAPIYPGSPTGAWELLPGADRSLRRVLDVASLALSPDCELACFTS